ncbi:hypothetical protein REPUB_Repub08aG0018000 [Reevesia pubescens]
MATAASTATSLTFALLPSQGLRGPTRNLPWTKTQRRYSRKAGSNLITAKFELKPPPYPMAWNHEFFWESMKPGGGGKPSGDLLDLIERDFGSFERFIEEFKSAAATQFGSGWAWLAYKANRLNVENAVNPWPSEKDKKLVVVKSPNAVNPLVWDYFPILTIDVWEHAYYLDFQNRRPDYISIFLDKLVSWEAVSARLEKAKAQIAEREMEEERRKKEEEEEKQTDGEAVEMYLDADTDDSEAE